jgi:shikimate kinase
VTGPRNVALIGFMGAGKSSVGGAVSRRTGLPLIDFDARIEERAGMSIARIFGRFGEARFRDLETELLREVAAMRGRLLVPGGGIVLREENRRLLRLTSHRIWLRIGVEEVRRRLSARKGCTGRPLLDRAGGADLAGLLSERERHYRDCDDIVDVDGRKLAEVVDRVIRSIERNTSLLHGAGRVRGAPDEGP